MFDFKDIKVIVLGLGESGLAAAKRLNQLDSNVLVLEIEENKEKIERASELDKIGVKTIFGEHDSDYLEGIELIIVSPGIPNHIPFIEIARGRHIKIWSEIELAYNFIFCPIIGVTGTNGKSTTTSMIGQILKTAGYHTIVAGNIGNPACSIIDDLKSDSYLVLELSSFQLENIVSFKPHISVMLNIRPDHLDWHQDFAGYLKSKEKIFSNQSFFDFAVLNYDDQNVRKISPINKTQIIAFTRKMQLENGIYLENGSLVSHFHKKETICSVDELSLKGIHNLENAMAATGASLACGIPVNPIAEVLKSFKGLEHRLEFVSTINGIDYYNDSKATNPDSTEKALSAFKNPIILLLGGKNKGNSFQSLNKEISRSTVKEVVLFGEAAEKLNEEITDIEKRWVKEGNFKDILKKAQKNAENGDIILLSPACASFDMFKDFEERGKIFKETVRKMGSKNEVA